MEIEQRTYQKNKWSSSKISTDYLLVFAFVAPFFLGNEEISDSLNSFYPDANIVFVSTAWEIIGNEVFDETISVTAIKFEKTSVQAILSNVKSIEDTSSVSAKMAKQLYADDLKHIIVFSDGIEVNGSEMIRWIKRILPKKVWVSGGTAWDGIDFKSTYVWLNSLSGKWNNIVMIGFYWTAINIWNCSIWWQQKFGEKISITKSIWNVLYECDWKPALDLYKEYLEKKKKWLISQWSLFSISIFNKDKNDIYVRSLSAVDEDERSLSFFWDIPEWHNFYLNKDDPKFLMRWASESIKYAYGDNSNPQFALVVSCIWRKMVLKDKTIEEIQIVADKVWENCKIAGFYSYGEFWVNKNKDPNYYLHNQTITITLLSEE